MTWLVHSERFLIAKVWTFANYYQLSELGIYFVSLWNKQKSDRNLYVQVKSKVINDHTSSLCSCRSLFTDPLHRQTCRVNPATQAVLKVTVCTTRSLVWRIRTLRTKVTVIEGRYTWARRTLELIVSTISCNIKEIWTRVCFLGIHNN